MDEQKKCAGFLRRAAAGVYDLLLASAVCVVAGFVGFLFARFALFFLWDGVPNDDFGYWLSHQWWYRLWLLACTATFYAYFWVKDKKTLGMAAWRMEIVDQNTGGKISFQTAYLRLCCSLFGLGNLLLLFHSRALQDILCRTHVLVVAKKERTKKAQ